LGGGSRPRHARDGVTPRQVMIDRHFSLGVGPFARAATPPAARPRARASASQHGGCLTPAPANCALRASTHRVGGGSRRHGMHATAWPHARLFARRRSGRARRHAPPAARGRGLARLPDRVDFFTGVTERVTCSKAKMPIQLFELSYVSRWRRLIGWLLSRKRNVLKPRLCRFPLFFYGYSSLSEAGGRT